MLFSCLWRNVETSCRKHFVVISRHQQTPPLTTSGKCHNLPRSGGTVLNNTWRLQRAMKPDIGHRAPVGIGNWESGVRKYDRGLSHLLHTELHRLDVPERVLYKLALMVHRCIHDKAPQYLSNYCAPVSEVASRQQLRSASRRQLLLIQRYRLRTFGRRAFAVAGPAF